MQAGFDYFAGTARGPVSASSGLVMEWAESHRVELMHNWTSLARAKKAVLATNKMLAHDKIFAMVGALGSVTAGAAMPLVLKQGLPHLFPITPADVFFDPFHKLKFAMFAPYYDDIRTGVKHQVQTRGKKHVGIMYQDDEFGANVLKGVKDQLAAMNLALASTTSYKRGATDFSSQIAKLKSDGVDLVVLGTIIRETVGAMTAARQAGWDVDFLGTQAVYVPEVPMLGKQMVEGLYGSGQTPIPEAATADAQLSAWLKRYEQKFGKPANVQAVSSGSRTTRTCSAPRR